MLPLLAFDLDGTLVDSANDICNAVNLTLTRYRFRTLPHSIIRQHIGEGLQKLILDFFPHFVPDSQDSIDVIHEFFDIYEKEMLKTTTLMPGVLDFLKSYQGPLGIITNKNERPTSEMVQHFQLTQIPWVAVFGAETWPEKKPSPMPLQEMMKLANRSPSQTFMIGDGTPDMASAQKAQVRAIAVEFGYTDMAILNSYRPAAVLTHYSELQRVIDSLKS